VGKPLPDSNAKIGYCAAKKRAFVGYRTTIISTNDNMAILDHYLTPANQHDSGALSPLLYSMEKHNVIDYIKDFYGDNAYNTEANRNWLDFYDINCEIHTKDESGKHRKNPRSAKRKSKIRSKVECVFGILHENYTFGRSAVRGQTAVFIETALIYSSWNYFILMSYFIDKFEDRISLKRLLYEN
jgi:hypothetical protein